MWCKRLINTITILIVNHNDWTPQQLPITTNGDIHTITTIPPHTIQYNPTLEWPKYYHFVEPSLVRRFRLLPLCYTYSASTFPSQSLFRVGRYYRPSAPFGNLNVRMVHRFNRMLVIGCSWASSRSALQVV